MISMDFFFLKYTPSGYTFLKDFSEGCITQTMTLQNVMSTHKKVCPVKFRTRSETVTHCRTSEKLDRVCVTHAHAHTGEYHTNPKGAGILVSSSHQCTPSAQSSGWHTYIAGMNKRMLHENHYI